MVCGEVEAEDELRWRELGANPAKVAWQFNWLFLSVSQLQPQTSTADKIEDQLPVFHWEIT